MHRRRLSEAERQSWASNRIETSKTCHGAPLILVWGLEHGKVFAACRTCKQTRPLGTAEFHRLVNGTRCPDCAMAMEAKKVPGHSPAENYGLECGACGHYLWLSDLLPKPDEI